MTVGSVTTTRAILIPLIAIIMGTFMVILDNTVVNVALPALQKSLNATLGDVQWVVAAYGLFTGALSTTWPLLDLKSRKSVKLEYAGTAKVNGSSGGR